jgi:hypothetical protein
VEGRKRPLPDRSRLGLLPSRASIMARGLAGKMIQTDAKTDVAPVESAGYEEMESAVIGTTHLAQGHEIRLAS